MSSRCDGRQSESTLRALSCELGTLRNCDGSAVWKSGHTAVLASVHGPIAPRQTHNEDASACLVSVVFRANASVMGNSTTSTNSNDPEWEDFLTKHLTACIVRQNYPRCVISVILQVLNSDGSVLAVAFHAAVSALMDAGIDMKILPTAVTCCSCTDGIIRLDPSYEEEQTAQGVFVFVFSPRDSSGGLLLGCQTSASLRQSVVKMLQCCTMASRVVPVIQAFWRLAMEKATRETIALKAPTLK